MATISKRGQVRQARVLRKGFPAEFKTFSTKTEAVRWSQVLECEMNRVCRPRIF
ncbi:MAG: hypothetical protein ACI8XC_000959 [Gammaproteobacteria bacterium]|jgi:hypothetical protein